jgi:galactokinase
MLEVADCPGRVNIIGDHTDYSGGFSLSMAIDLTTKIKAKELTQPVITVYSTETNKRITVSLNDVPFIDFLKQDPTERFIKAAAKLSNLKHGLDLKISSTLPISSGLSSSAALSVGLLLVMHYPFNSALDLAKAAQKTEHLATGVPCGLLDQISIVMGKKNHALFIDFSNNEVQPVFIDNSFKFLVIHSGIYRTLENQSYKQRFEEVQKIQSIIGPLKDAKLEDLKQISDPQLKKRAKHVITENNRVKSAIDALKEKDLFKLGAILNESHVSLSTDFEVSNPEIDDLIAHLNSHPNVLGARLTGAGFGGCIVALITQKLEINYLRNLKHWYLEPSDGATLKTY